MKEIYFMARMLKNEEYKNDLFCPVSFSKKELDSISKEERNSIIIRDMKKMFPYYFSSGTKVSISKVTKKAVLDYLKTGVYIQKSVLNKRVVNS